MYSSSLASPAFLLRRSSLMFTWWRRRSRRGQSGWSSTRRIVVPSPRPLSICREAGQGECHGFASKDVLCRRSARACGVAASYKPIIKPTFLSLSLSQSTAEPCICGQEKMHPWQKKTHEQHDSLWESLAVTSPSFLLWSKWWAVRHCGTFVVNHKAPTPLCCRLTHGRSGIVKPTWSAPDTIPFATSGNHNVQL